MKYLSVPLSAAVDCRFTWRCLIECNILNLNTPISEDSLVTPLTGLLTLCGINELYPGFNIFEGWG